MSLKIIQWATGGVGKAAIENVVDHPDLELVGCWVHGEAKHGRDVGEIVGCDNLGVTATSNVDDLLALEADCVVYSPLIPDEDVVKAILRSGKNVVTPVGWIYPDRNHPNTVAIEEACQQGGATLHGSGIHPGGITERFPLMVAALSSSITHIRAEEFSDIRTYNAPDVVHQLMGFGKTPSEATNGPMAQLMSSGFKASIRMIADAMELTIDPKIRCTQTVAVATKTIDSDVLSIGTGMVAARRFRWEALVRGEPVITAAVNWLFGEENLDLDWTFGDSGERFELEITGKPGLTVTFKGLQPVSVAAGLIRNPGVVATANHCVNAIPYVCAASPGIKTYLDLPLITGRAASDLVGSARRSSTISG
jgi:hypothetical protein